MDWEFINKELAVLYRTGKSRKHKGLPPLVVKKFIARMDQIQAANSIHDLWKSTSLHFEKLQGHKNRYSVRVDRQWRLEIEIEWEDDMQTKGFFRISDLSNHYGD